VDPYQIATGSQLIAVGSDPSLYDKHFVLSNDVDLDPNKPSGKVFIRAVIAANLTPDGSQSHEFTGPIFAGSFDGSGHAIRNLTIRTGTGHYLGLFGKTGSNAVLCNLTLESVRVSISGSNVGGLVGYNRGCVVNCRISGTISGGIGEYCTWVGLLAGENSGRISDCVVNGSVEAGTGKSGWRIGLLVGYNHGPAIGCRAEGSISGQGEFDEVGGLIGDNLADLADCEAAVNISIDTNSLWAEKFGGLVGLNQGAISRCRATGDLSFARRGNDAGGLVGSNQGMLVACCATGDISAPAGTVGGLAGDSWGHILCCYAEGNVNADGSAGGLIGVNNEDVTASYATGRVTGWEDRGGLVGSAWWSDWKYTNLCFWDMETSGLSRSQGGTGLTTAQMRDPRTFLAAGWDFVHERTNGTPDIWLKPQGGGYPTLAVFAEGYRRPTLRGSGAREDPYQISTPEDLGAILHCDCQACYELIADIDLAGITWTTPVIPSFNGQFDGGGFAIRNLKMQAGGYLGLFGWLGTEALVENLRIEAAHIVVPDPNASVGILAVENDGRIMNCQAAGDIVGATKENALAGLVGTNWGTIVNCGPITYDGPYTVVVTDPQEVRWFVRCDDVWTPGAADLDGLDSALRAYLDSDTPVRTGTFPMNPVYIPTFLRQYNREYAGFIKTGHKYIVCNMFMSWFGVDPLDNAFTYISDGGCSVLKVIFDADTKMVMSVDCNGEA